MAFRANVSRVAQEPHLGEARAFEAPKHPRTSFLSGLSPSAPVRLLPSTGRAPTAGQRRRPDSTDMGLGPLLVQDGVHGIGNGDG